MEMQIHQPQGQSIANIDNRLCTDTLGMDISKWHFLRDIGKSFQEVTPIGPEPHHFFFLFQISRPKFWKSLASLFVEIFEKEKKWWGSGPIGVTS